MRLGSITAALWLFASATAQADTAEFLANWGLAAIGADKALEKGFTGAGVTVGVVDVSIELTHPEFYGRAAPFQFDDVDDGDHGTHVGGIIGAARDGVGMHGVAPDVLLSSIRIFEASGAWISTQQVADGYDAAVAAGIRIFNNSWGINYDITWISAEDTAAFLGVELGAYRRAVAADSVLVWATGNGSHLNAELRAGLPYLFPELASNWIAVGAVDSNLAIPYFSSYCGVAANWCISAPGVGVYSAVTGGSYGNKDGTSMATPHVTGAVAIATQMFPQATGAELTAIVLRTATDLGPAGVDEHFGWGMLNVGNLVDTIDPLNGALYANAAYGRFAAMETLFGTISNRIAEARVPETAAEILSYGPVASAPGNAFADIDGSTTASGRGVWASGIVGQSMIGAGATSPEAQVNMVGGVVGFDLVDTGDWRFGMALGATRSDLSTSGSADSAEMTGIHGLAYATWMHDDWFADAIAGASWFGNSYHRFDISGSAGTALAGAGLAGSMSANGYGLGSRVAVGRSIAMDRHWLQPYLHASWLHQNTGSGMETGADIFSLSLGSASLDRYEGGVGLRFGSAPIEFSTHSIDAVLDIAYARQGGDRSMSVATDLLGTPLHAQTAELGRDVLQLGAKLQSASADGRAVVYAGYNGRLQNNASSHSISAGFAIRF